MDRREDWVRKEELEKVVATEIRVLSATPVLLGTMEE